MRSLTSWLLAVSVSEDTSTPATCSTASRRAALFASAKAFSLLPSTMAASPVTSFVTVAGGGAAANATEASSRDSAVSFRDMAGLSGVGALLGDDDDPALGQEARVDLGQRLRVVRGEHQVRA